MFPDPYKAVNKQDDILGGPLQKYLEGLLTASNVQEYVKDHPFGQPAITRESQNWHFYRQVLPMSTMPSKNLQDNGLLHNNMQVTVIDQHSVPGMGVEKNSVADPKEKKKGISHPGTCTQQQTDHGMEKEENGLAERVRRIYQAVSNGKHKSHHLCKEDKEAGLRSDHAWRAESVLKKGLWFSKWKKKFKYHRGTCFYRHMLRELFRRREKKQA